MKKFICFFTALTLIMALPMVVSAATVHSEISWTVDFNWIDREYVLIDSGTDDNGLLYTVGYVKISDVTMTVSEFSSITNIVAYEFNPSSYEATQTAVLEDYEFAYGNEVGGNNLYSIYVPDAQAPLIIYTKGTVAGSDVGMTGTFTEGVWVLMLIEADYGMTISSFDFSKYEYQMGDVGADLGIVKEDLANITSEIKNGFINLFVPDTNGQGASDKFLSQVDSNKQEASDIKDQLDSVNKPDADDLHDQVNPDQFIDKEDESVIEMNAVIASVFDLKILGKYIMVLLGLGFVSLIFFGKKEG